MVNTAQLYLVNKDILETELEAIKRYLLNPVDSRFKDITRGIERHDFSESDKVIPTLDFFKTYTSNEFKIYKAEQGLAMEVDDLVFIQEYFKSIGRVPTETELRVLDTYWSDHCRHTTFETELKHIDFSASKFQKQLQATYDKYIAMREELGRSDKPQTLMDMATIFGRYECANGRLDDMEVSDEINACSVEIDVDVDGVKEPWLLMFKNETHNHPTEIEPLVEQQLVLVEPFVIHYQGDRTFIKRCVFQVLETLQRLFLILALENSLSKSFQNSSARLFLIWKPNWSCYNLC